MWTADLFNGNYIINVKAPGHSETNQFVEIRPGKKHFNIVCPVKNSVSYNLKLYAVNILTGKRVKDTFIQMYKSTS